MRENRERVSLWNTKWKIYFGILLWAWVCYRYILWNQNLNKNFPTKTVLQTLITKINPTSYLQKYFKHSHHVKRNYIIQTCRTVCFHHCQTWFYLIKIDRNVKILTCVLSSYIENVCWASVSQLKRIFYNTKVIPTIFDSVLI